MLDITIFKSNGRLRWMFYRKDSARHLPLSTESFHPQAVHWSWPVAEIGRAWKNSQSWKHFIKARNMMTDRWQECYMPAAIVARCKEWRPNLRMPVQCDLLRHNSLNHKLVPKIVRLILPFHPCLHGLQSVLQKLACDFQGVLPFAIAVRIVYRKGGRHLIQLLQHLM